MASKGCSLPRKIRNLLIVGAVASMLVPSAMAQSVHVSPRNFDNAVVEVVKPRFADGGTSFLTAAYSASYHFGVGPTGRVFLTASLPFSHTGFDGSDAETALGNPYLGVTLFSKRDPVVYEFGVRLPVASDNPGQIAGLFGDYDRFEGYQPDLLSFKTSLIYFPSRSGDWVMFTRISPLLAITTGQTGSEARGELYADYSVHFFYYGKAIQGGLGLTGRAIVTEDGSFAERTSHHVGFEIQKDLGSIIPGIQFRLPIDSDIRDVVDYVFGLTIVVPT
ncbi:MAG: hypothetical protein HKN37_00965 [Rhodothermales bacterium]|nr:hypothetical protein [Rhodothermales bacterium]